MNRRSEGTNNRPTPLARAIRSSCNLCLSNSFSSSNSCSTAIRSASNSSSTNSSFFNRSIATSRNLCSCFCLSSSIWLFKESQIDCVDDNRPQYSGVSHSRSVIALRLTFRDSDTDSGEEGLGAPTRAQQTGSKSMVC